MNTINVFTFIGGFALATLLGTTQDPTVSAESSEPVSLGAFSVSLAVKDIHASKAFYEKLEFEQLGGDIKQNWVVLRNGTTAIGLFQGMFEETIMTFNPGWGPNAEPLKEDFADVRELQQTFKERGLNLTLEVDELGSGPGSVMLQDPDGNAILVDQHVPSPKR